MSKKTLLICLVRALYICLICSCNLCNQCIEVSGVGVNPQLFEETEYSVIGGRNIFTGKKEAPVVPPPPPLTEPEPVKKETAIQRVSEVENVILTGIIFLGDKYQALLEDKTTTKGFILSEGETFEGKGIKVVSVSEGNVVLESGGENLEMVIERESKVGAGGPGQFPGMYPPGFPGGAPPVAPPVTDTGRSARTRRARTTTPRYTPPTGVMPGGAPGMGGAEGWMPPPGQYPPVVPGFPPYPEGGGE